MVTVRERLIGDKIFYYLEHSVREGKKVVKHEKYLGDTLPKDLDWLKREFAEELYRQRWLPQFDSIMAGYARHQKSLPESARKKELDTFAVRFTYNTNRIEGSKLTLMETSQLLEHGITPGARPARDIKEAEAHREIFLEMMDSRKNLSYDLLLYYHRCLFESTKRDIAGQLRTYQVEISGSKFLPPLAVEVYPLLMEFMDWYKKSKLHPVELAALVHLRLVTIHPFADGNGRISRLMMNLELRKHGFPMLDIPYEKRAGYYNALERSQMKKDDTIFLQWFFRRYLKENGKYMEKGRK